METKVTASRHTFLRNMMVSLPVSHGEYSPHIVMTPATVVYLQCLLYILNYQILYFILLILQGDQNI
jgi:hypothetical protein